ncbi:MAG TPA: sodium:proton antiporter [Dermatophilaceae bacterium]|nr:sodium:proton antiporter [Dermatophilaceae bacterium]HMT89369.1 sodium:proton antiporter [Dermatophilaceae bacterium]
MATAFAILLCLAAVLGWINERFIKIPTTVGVTLAGAVASILLIVLDTFGLTFGLKAQAQVLLETLDFTTFVLNGILSVLLFAGALSLDARQLWSQRASILTLASVSTIISTVLIGLVAWGVFRLVGLDVPLAGALLFGALISPTDPVAVLDLLKRAKVPKKIETLIAGESLFNDGVGVVLFIVIAGAAGISSGHGEASLTGAVVVFVQEAIGGMAFGAVLGWIGYRMCASIDGHVVEVIITLALVLGGYFAATAMGMSGPLAMVVAGLIVSATKERAFYEETRHHVEGFWETLDQVLNILLFAFIGLDVLLTETTVPQIVASVILIVAALAIRFVSVWAPMHLVRSRDGYGDWTVRLLTWGGLRGGIAISLALGLPASPYRTHLVTATYAIVLFTIAVQGLTVMPIVRRAVAAEAASLSD